MIATRHIIELSKTAESCEDDYIVGEKEINFSERKNRLKIIDIEHMKNTERLRQEGQLIQPGDMYTFK
jgi:hypothetical protein